MDDGRVDLEVGFALIHAARDVLDRFPYAGLAASFRSQMADPEKVAGLDMEAVALRLRLLDAAATFMSEVEAVVAAEMAANDN